MTIETYKPYSCIKCNALVWTPYQPPKHRQNTIQTFCVICKKQTYHKKLDQYFLMPHCGYCAPRCDSPNIQDHPQNTCTIPNPEP